MGEEGEEEVEVEGVQVGCRLPATGAAGMGHQSISDVQVKDPNNPANLIDSKFILFRQ